MANPINIHSWHMVHAVTIQANRAAGKATRGGGAAEDWVLVAAGVPCLVTEAVESTDPQRGGGRSSPEGVRRYRVAFAEAPPDDLGRNHRLIWDAGDPFGARLLAITAPLSGDPLNRIFTLEAEDRGETSPDTTSRPGALAFSATVYLAGESGTAAITVVRSGGTDGTGAATVAATGGTATAGADYAGLPAVVRFRPGESSRTIPIPIPDDADFESNETVVLSLGSPTGGATIGTPSAATLVIGDDDSAAVPGEVAFAAASASVAVAEGEVATVALSRSEGTHSAVSVTVSVSDAGTAEAGVDFVDPGPILVEWADGDDADKAIELETIDDPGASGGTPRTLVLTLSEPTGGATLGTPASLTLSIVDDEAPALVGSFHVGDAAYADGASTVRAWHGDRVATIGGWEGIGESGPLWQGHPDRLAADADGPGLQRAIDRAFAGTAFDLYLRADGLHFGVGGDLLSASWPDGSRLSLSCDGGGILALAIAGAVGSNPATISASEPIHGSAAVLGGSTTKGKAQTVATLTLGTRLDLCPGDLVKVAGCGSPFDGPARVVRSWAWDGTAGIGTLTYATGSDQGGNHAPALGAVTPTGRYTDPAVWWSGTAEQEYPPAIRVVREGDTIRIYERTHLRGEATVPGLPALPDSGAVVTLGATGSGTPPPLVPGRMALHDRPLAGEAEWQAFARTCMVISGAEPCFLEFESFPGLWRDELHLAEFVHLWIDDATGAIVDGASLRGDRQGVGHGTHSGDAIGEHGQAGTTTCTLRVVAFSGRWSEAGAYTPPAVLGVVDVCTIVRRPWDGAPVVAGAGQAMAAIAAAPPGGVVRLANGTNHGMLSISNRGRPLLIAPEDPAGAVANPPVVGAPEWALLGMTDCREVLVAGPVAIRHEVSPASNSWGGDGVSYLRSYGCWAGRVRDATGGLAAAGVVLRVQSSSHCGLTDWESVPAPGNPEGGYVLYGDQASRNIVIRRGTSNRKVMGTTHILRFICARNLYVAGVAHTPGGLGTVTPRWDYRRLYMGDCDWRDHTFDHQPPNTDAVDYDPARPIPVSVGAVVERCRGGWLNGFGSGGSRITSCVFSLYSLHDGVYDADRQAPAARRSVVEGCLSGSTYTLGSLAMRAAPTSGPWANRAGPTNYATGQPLTAPGLIDLASASWPGMILAAADGGPSGGTGRKTGSVVVDGEPVLPAPPSFVALPATAGSHAVRVDVADEAGATASGPTTTIQVP
jgi:hypothetical protein